MQTFFKEKDAQLLGLKNNIDPTASYKKESKTKTVKPFSKKSKRNKTKRKSILAHCEAVFRVASKVFRKQDAINRGDGERVKCVTCEREMRWEKFGAGHFITRRVLNIYFDFRNVHCQCDQCNGVLEGNYKKYREFIVERYGEEVAVELEKEKYKVSTVTHGKLDKLRDFFIQKSIELHV